MKMDFQEAFHNWEKYWKSIYSLEGFFKAESAE